MAKKFSKGAARFLVAVGIALVGWAVAVGIEMTAPGAGRMNEFFYDTFYGLRPEQDMKGAEVMLVVADDASAQAVQARFSRGWPWPREFWGHIVEYLNKAGARVMAFDITFPERSTFQNETGDDDTFAELINASKVPVVFGSSVQKDGAWGPFAPPVKNPVFGAVNFGNDKVYRRYMPEAQGRPSLAKEARELAGGGGAADDWTKGSLLHEPFLMHYYGPYERKTDGTQTFRYVSAYAVLSAAIDGEKGEKAAGISPEMFRGKIIILGAVGQGMFDLKSSPLSKEYPGPEVHATALENMLRGEKVSELPRFSVLIVALGLAMLATAGVVLVRSTVVKVASPVVMLAVLFALSVVLFRGERITWMTPVPGLLAILVATPVAFGWTYFAEDRQRRFMLKALSKVVSPAVAEQLSREPERLALGTVRGEITVVFTDLANFTDMAEGMDVQHLGELINRYLGEMSAEVFRQDGTLDKYIGDAVMCFWNAPLPQADHAARACRAALAMLAREKALYEEMAAGGGGGVAKKLYTRIGINTAAVAVGFVGSEHLFNYTALGDGVNLASRLEGANKIYGSRILLSENTAGLVKELFWLRKVDVLRVKGKKEPMAVYELMAARGGGAGGAGAAGEEERAVREQITGYEAAFAAYQGRQWDEAERLLLEVSGRFGQDGPTMALLARVREFRDVPPPENWDGVTISQTK